MWIRNVGGTALQFYFHNNLEAIISNKTVCISQTRITHFSHSYNDSFGFQESSCFLKTDYLLNRSCIILIQATHTTGPLRLNVFNRLLGIHC
uniref:Uncharacterized protein n=1 Tax=Anguilla anguilla TaxID=7936 RepID=A0A0E9WZQ8_ANGAN